MRLRSVPGTCRASCLLPRLLRSDHTGSPHNGILILTLPSRIVSIYRVYLQVLSEFDCAPDCGEKALCGALSVIRDTGAQCAGLVRARRHPVQKTVETEQLGGCPQIRGWPVLESAHAVAPARFRRIESAVRTLNRAVDIVVCHLSAGHADANRRAEAPAVRLEHGGGNGLADAVRETWPC